MKKLFIVLAIATAIVPTSLSFARGAGGGGSMGGGMGASSSHGGTTNHSGAGTTNNSSTNSGFGGNSSTHISTQGAANTNGPNAVDRDFGKDRAEDRANAHGLKHLTALHGRSNNARKSEREMTDDLNSEQLHGAGNSHSEVR